MFDVFVSYGHADQDWVRTLAENLYREGLEVFYDEWEIVPGDVLVHRLDEGIRSSSHGIVVVSPAAWSSRWVLEEYAAMLTQAVTHRQRLVPVLLGEAELPPFLASRVWVDFRHADGPEYLRRVGQLVAALRGEGGSRPARGELLVGPPGSGFRPEGPRRATLRLGPTVTTFTDDRGDVSHSPRGVSPTLHERLWELDRARRRGASDADESVLHRCSLAAGTALTKAFLVGAAGTALAQAVAAAEQVGGSLELAVDVDESLAELPWEILRLPDPEHSDPAGAPGPPLVLYPHVNVYRTVSGLGSTSAMAIPGPLRLLVAIGSPEVDNERGELLDYEAELARLLDAVELPRRDQRAYVRLLNAGTVSALRAVLDAQRFHVLHLSCHARPGVLDLEDDEGREDQVTAARVTTEVLPPDRGVPLVVLSGCATALGERGGEGEAALPGLARELLAHGVPAVLAMTATVSDRYATALAAELYRQLAVAESPNVLTAVSNARRQVEAQRQRSTDRRVGELAEWGTPALFARGPVLPLYDRAEPFEEIQLPPEPQFGPEVVVRRVGEFVGRRAESRHGRQALRQHAGLVIHGIGGVGKSTLAAHLVGQLGEQTGLVVAVSGATTPDAVLAGIGRRLLNRCLHDELPDAHPWRQLAGALREPKLDWRDRLDLLIEQFGEPLVLLLDNFEDNLTGVDGEFTLADAELAAFLSRWVRTPSRARLLITSRYPFPLPEQAERWLSFRHLGPLSWPETRKLFWRLPGLDALPFDEQRRAYQDVGGHPRTLEYLDALLRAGATRFPDLAARMERALAARGLTLPGLAAERADGWTLDAALAEAITLAVDDVALGQLLDHLHAVPLARRLLVGASVYRLPVDDIGLHWQVGEEQPPPADPERDARLNRLAAAQQAARAEGRSDALEAVGFPAAERDQLARDLAELRRPPLRVALGVEQAKAALLDLGLLAPTHGNEPISYLVHRWTAGTLAGREPPDALTDAHRKAARYWRWRVRVWPRSPTDGLEQLLEARYHHHAAGELDQAIAVSYEVCDRLDTWGAYAWEERLCQETLAWVPSRSGDAAAFIHELGILAHLQGDYAEADRQYRRSLEIKEKLGDRAGMATSYGQLGILAQDRGDYAEAERQCRRALEIFEKLGDRAGMATSYGQLGMLAQLRGDYAEAERQYRRALEIFEKLGDRAGMSKSYHQLGILSHLQGDYAEAERQYHRSLEIKEKLGDRAGMATSYHQLGILAQDRGDYAEAERQCRRALEIFEKLGDRAGVSASYHNLGMLAQLRGDYAEAERQYRRALEIKEKLGGRAGMSKSYHQLGILAHLQGDYAEAERQYRRSLEIKEKLGDRAGMASSYGQLGILAQDRGDYAEAERQYRRALEIFEKLGDRAGMATTLSQLGVLLTETGDVEDAVDAVGYNIRGLALRLAIGSPDARIDVHWLRRQQELLGDARFDELLRTQLDETSIANLKDYLNSAATDDQGVQRHLSQWEPMIAAVVATVEGNDDAAAPLRSLLDELGATSDWGALVAVLRRILAGERGEQLLAGLDAVDTAIARETLRRVEN